MFSYRLEWCNNIQKIVIMFKIKFVILQFSPIVCKIVIQNVRNKVIMLLIVHNNFEKWFIGQWAHIGQNFRSTEVNTWMGAAITVFKCWSEYCSKKIWYRISGVDKRGLPGLNNVYSIWGLFKNFQTKSHKSARTRGDRIQATEVCGSHKSGDTISVTEYVRVYDFDLCK